MLRQELRESAVYSPIISAIAAGPSRLNKIAAKVQLESLACSKYLENLIDLQIIRKIEPIVKKTDKQAICRIRDPFFRFWYRYVPANMLAITEGRMDRVCDMTVGADISNYMGQIFEAMCRAWLVNHADCIPFQLGSIGNWWDGHPIWKKEVELDVVGIGSKTFNQPGGKQYLIGSCKYRSFPFGVDELDLIADYATAFTVSEELA